MTTATAPAPRGLRSRTLNVVRLQLINTQSFVWVPLLILAAAAVLSVLIFAMIPGDGVKTAGAANAPLWYFMALGVQAMTLSFPFSQAMSITRREFYVGTLIIGAIGAAMMATLFLILAGIEVLTDGYGVNGWVAHLDYLFEPGWASAWLSYFTFTLFLYVLGFVMATIWKRFGTFAVVAVGVAIGLAVLLAIFFVTRSGSWPDVIAWFVDITALGITLVGLAVTAVLAVVGYAILRRATV
ncbi:hypothetical protein [Microbacterium halophytorum]|uniref:hypothetical protein n=1 Tax=Microbacterium halophytorum TaxID=2067568 RepID=UPI000CFCE72F|nr:hypothetical protein [Microbacterium halophytorum]